MAKVEYSSDFRASVDGLSEAVLYALKMFKADPESRLQEAQNEVGCKLRQLNRLVGQIHHAMFPEAFELKCTRCGAIVRAEKIFWSGVCYDCVGRG